MRAYHFVAEKYALLAIRNRRLKVATLNDLNDPFELLSADFADSRLRRPFRVWKRRMSRTLGLLCFSKTWGNPLLWSHYADKHKGIALQVEIADDVAVPVTYRRKRLQLDMAKVLERGSFTDQFAETLASTKSWHWEYEKEIRVPVDLADCDHEDGLWFAKFDDDVRLRGIVCGPLSRLRDSDIESSLPKNVNIEVRRARLAFTSFSIVPNKEKPMKRIRGKR